VTLTGVGGVGKTRLAVQVAAELLPAFPDGAWFCELAAADDGDALAQVVASTLDVMQRAGRSLERSIVEFLGSARLLLVLDNCEHLLDPSGRLASAIMAECPQVHVLATSREALAVPGEQVWPLRSLDVPDLGAGLEEAADAASVRLFTERAAGARPGFALSEVNAAAVAEVCRRLDGIPLAIELAAARSTAMSPAEIAGLLGERFRLLTGGRRTAVERHQTLRAAVDWSYSLLSPTEQAVFCRLAVFSGGFNLAAATAVVTGDGIETWDVVDAIDSLVAKSMVVAEPGDAEHTRYQLLETLRQYAQEGLDADGQTDRWRRRHAENFADFATELSRGLRGRDELGWRQRLMDDLDNLRSAVTWGLDRGLHDDEQTAVAIVARLALEAGSRGTGIGQWAEQAIPAAERSTPGHRSAVLGATAMATMTRGDLDATEGYARAAVRDGYPDDDPAPASGVISLAVALMYSGRKAEAARYLDEAEAATRGRDEQNFVRTMIQNLRVAVSLFADDEEQEITQARLAKKLAEGLGNPSMLAMASYGLGWALRHRDLDEAMAEFDQSVTLNSRGAANSTVFALSLSFGARIAASRGDADGASVRLKQALWESARDDAWNTLSGSLDAAVDTFFYLDDLQAAATLAGAFDTAFAPLRWPYISIAGPGLTVRTANLERTRQTLGQALYDEAWAKGASMSWQDALAFALDRL
jgi:predicted ATPase